MLYINDAKLEVKNFPDNSQMLFNMNFPESNKYLIKWVYHDDSECMTLCYIVNHIRNSRSLRSSIELMMLYLPNARMDRVKSDDEVFTLKYFCKFINDLQFDRVHILDPHSNVGVSNLDRVKSTCPDEYVLSAFNECIKESKTILYFPDKGAKDRYTDVITNIRKSCTGLSPIVIYGDKRRDWNTGQILGLDIFNENGISVNNINDILTDDSKGSFKDIIILGIDDICSYGGTAYYSALELKNIGFTDIRFYFTHLEESIKKNPGNTNIYKTGVLSKVYTTNSLYSQYYTSDDKGFIILV